MFKRFAIVVSIFSSLLFATPAFAAADKQAPTAPATLVATSISTNSVSMQWSKSTDNVAVTGYYIYQNAIKIDSTTTSLAFVAKNLSSNTAYTFTIKAHDRAGNLSANSPLLNVTTQSDVVISWNDCSGGYIAFTFDDGPVTNTAATVAQLKKYNIKATFFDVGENVTSNPAATRSQLSQGEIGNHTWDHQSMSGASTGTAPLTISQIQQEINSTQSAVFNATGFTPQLFRPPYGDTSANLTAVEQQLGLIEVGWTVDTEDWQNPPSSQIAATFLTAQPGGIVLMHDGRANTINAIPAIVTGMQSKQQCPGRIVYDSVGFVVWDGWTSYAKAVAW